MASSEDAIERALGELRLCAQSHPNGEVYWFMRGNARRILSTLVREARVEALREAHALMERRSRHTGLDELAALIAAVEESGR